ncbi:hypothetical protein PG997_011841 [Apiospora hydei]|uniref:Uncharacterized protein n=1 Tax=Apiospora hydei TaxID=1337664 RepID=A0ABR1V1M8_9PEZI
MAAEQGVPVFVPMTGTGGTRMTSSLDGVSIPARWGGKVILVTDNVAGTHVLYSADATWTTADFRGTVPVAKGLLESGGVTVATVSLGGGNVFAVTEYFGDAKVPGSRAGNRSQWPLIDITADVEALL